MPVFGTVSVTDCFGTLHDDGGPTANYSNFTDGTFVIQPTGAQSVTLTFTAWNWVQSQPGDFLHIHDGPSTASPLIGSFTGNATPNGGVPITSSGGAITLRQETNFAVTDPGFSLNWTCVALPPTANFVADSLVTCDGMTVFTDLSTDSPTSWAWDFGDGSGTSTVPSPSYTYATPGTYDVKLIVSNLYGIDSMTVTIVYDPTSCQGPAPTAEFTSDVTTTCTGVINFTDLSIDSPINWLWDFGDTGGSSDQNPQHVYSTPGTYTVTLTASNGTGSDNEVKTNFITYDPTLCDTAFIPVQGSGTTQTSCDGVIMDNGGIANYTNNTDATMTIAPMGAVQITLDFVSFNFVGLEDSLYIYDGMDVNSPLIGGYSFSTLPNGGMVSSTGGAITLRQVSDGANSAAGFHANWTCVTSINETEFVSRLSLYPNPTDDQVTIEFACIAGCNDAQITVSDALGKIVRTKNISFAGEFKEQLDVSDFADGVYYVTVSTDQGQSVKKLIIH